MARMTQPTVAIDSFATKSRPNSQNAGHNTNVTPRTTKTKDNTTFIEVDSGKAAGLEVRDLSPSLAYDLLAIVMSPMLGVAVCEL